MPHSTEVWFVIGSVATVLPATISNARWSWPRDRKLRGIIHYNLALIDLAVGDRKSCAVNVQSALELGNPDAKELSQRLHR